jgi:integrase
MLEKFALQSFNDTPIGNAISAWQVRLGSSDLFIDDGVLVPLRATSIREKGKLLAQFVRCAHSLGIVSHTASLRRTFTARNLSRVLQAVGSQRARRSRYQMALAVKDFSLNWLKVPIAEVAEMASICRRLRPIERGLSEENHSRLFRLFFRIDAHSILDLPFIIADAALDSSKGVVRPVDFATAAYLVVLFYCPMPISQISNLQLKDIRQTKNGWIIEKEAVRFRSRYLISYRISGDAANLIAAYLHECRFKLRGALVSNWLFPGRKNGTSITQDAMRRKIKKLYEEISPDLDVRLLRWLVGCYYLADNPDDLEGLKHLLGFNNVSGVSELYDSFRRCHMFTAYHEKIGARRLPQSR